MSEIVSLTINIKTKNPYKNEERVVLTIDKAIEYLNAYKIING
jgi:hypothetical protein